ncbi:MAG: hypothetical protein ACRD30_07665 [Bryobacteraceae bacterium]
MARTPATSFCGNAPMKTFLLILFLSAAAAAQPPIAPTSAPVGNPNGENSENYNIVNSFELGYRFASVGGDTDMYRSAVNYTDGVRLLASSLSIHSRDGHGKWFDDIVLNTQGLGNDPYESASLRVAKNRLYTYGMAWRLNDYFNPALTIASGEHLRNTTRIMQDHDLTLFPDSRIKFFFGYSRNTDSGAALSTVQLFDFRGDEYPVFADIHDHQNEFRLGGEAKFLGFRLNVLRGWVDFKQNEPSNITTPEAGNNPNDLNTLSLFERTQPIHGTSPYWRIGLFREGKRLWAVDGRFAYTSANRAFIYNELAGGTTVGGLTTQQILSSGDARRPSLAANWNTTLFPASFITITNQTTFNNNRSVGDAVYSQYFLGGPIAPVIPYTYLAIRTFANSTSAEIRARKWLAIHAGYQYSDRRIGVVDNVEPFGAPAPAPPDNVPVTQSNHLNAGTFGLRIRPVQPLSILLDGEIGRNSEPYTPISNRNYQAFRGRIEYHKKSFRVMAYARTDYNNNSISLTSFASRSRNYGADVSWTPAEWFSLDTGYSKLHLNTLGGIDFFANNVLLSQQSLYISNIHTATLGARFAIAKRADIFVGYNQVQDVGDGRATPFDGGLYSTLPAFQAAQTFPLRFLSPSARLSISVNKRVRWNLVYQYYGYGEEFALLQNFRANTGYSSISFAF